MLLTTNGIVLRTIKYGETSLVATIFTELLGIQSYLVNGIRTSGKTGQKIALFQPATILSLVAYNHPNKNLQRLKEFNRAHQIPRIFEDVVKNCVAQFVAELLYKTQKQPEPNTELYAFAEDALMHLNKANAAEVANFPVFFTAHLAYFLGIKIQLPSASVVKSDQFFFDMEEGRFTAHQPTHPNFFGEEDAKNLLLLIQITQPEFLPDLKLTQASRKSLLQQLLNYFSYHLQDFGTMKTLPVLYEIFR